MRGEKVNGKKRVEDEGRGGTEKERGDTWKKREERERVWMEEEC